MKNKGKKKTKKKPNVDSGGMEAIIRNFLLAVHPTEKDWHILCHAQSDLIQFSVPRLRSMPHYQTKMMDKKDR